MITPLHDVIIIPFSSLLCSAYAQTLVYKAWGIIIITTNLHCSPLIPSFPHFHHPVGLIFSLSLSLKITINFCSHAITHSHFTTHVLIKLLPLSTMQQEQLRNLPRTTSCSRSTKRIIPSNYPNSSSSFKSDPSHETSKNSLIQKPTKTRSVILSTLLKSLLNLFSIPSLVIPATCRLLSLPTTTTPPLGRKVTGTLFGHRRGHVTFAVQTDPRSEPVLLIELAISTSNLVKEMSSGLVRIALESEKERSLEARGRHAVRRLYDEPMWTMYCNGRKLGYASTRACGESDWHVLSTVRSVSVGAGVIPVVDGGRKEDGLGLGELLYMRARFERVVGSRDSEAFYMMNPDGNGGPELSVFLLKI